MQIILLGQGLLLGLVADALATQASPRSPNAQQVEAIRLLQSTNPREQAWGAWLAERNGFRDTIPLLESVVSMRLESDGLADTAAVDIALDALIQLDAKVPSELLQIVHARRPAQALILVSRNTEDSDLAVLDLLRTSGGLEWFAVADIAVSRNIADTAATLLRDLRFTRSVVVSSDGNRGWLEGGAGGVAVGCGVSGPAAGLPPWPAYALTSVARPGVVVLATGPTPIYYERTVAAAGSTPAGHSVSVEGPSTDDRLKYVAVLLRVEHADLGLRADESYPVAWHGEAALQAEITRIRGLTLQSYAAVLQRLIHAQLLTPDDATALGQPEVRVRVRHVLP